MKLIAERQNVIVNGVLPVPSQQALFDR